MKKLKQEFTMAPVFKDDEIVEQLNYIFSAEDAASNIKINVQSLRSKFLKYPYHISTFHHLNRFSPQIFVDPNQDSTKDIIHAVLKEAAFAMNSSTFNLPMHLTGPDELPMVQEFIGK